MKNALSISVVPSLLGSLAVLTSALPASAINIFPASTGPVTALGSGATSTFSLTFINNTGTNSITDVSLTLNSLTGISDLGNIELYLTSPNSNILTLKDFFTNSGLTSYSNVRFTDAGVNNISAASSAATSPLNVNPVTGSYKPEGSSGSLNATFTTFADFNAESLVAVNNTWTLTVFNNDSNTANLNATLEVTAVPFEFEGSAGILTLGAIWGVNKWRKNRIKK